MRGLISGSVLFLILIFIFPMFILTCSKVEQGYRGAKVDLYAGEKGEITEYGPGYHWYNPIGVDFINLPIYTQRYAYVQDPEEESKKDQSFTAVSSDNLSFNVGMAIHYGVNPVDGCATAMYRKYKTGNFGDLSLGPVRDVVRDVTKNRFSQFEAEEIYGSQRPEVMQAVTEQVKSELKARVSIERNGKRVNCFSVDQLNLAELDAPDRLRQAVQQKMEAQQQAEEAKSRLREQKINSRKDSIRVAQEAENNRRLAESITPELVRYMQAKAFVDSWDGQVPKVTGSGNMGLMLDDSTLEE